MSEENEYTAEEKVGGLLESDRANGLRARLLRRAIAKEAISRDLDQTQAWTAITQDVIPSVKGSTIDHVGIATKYGFDPQKWIDFINAIMPLITQFMAMCGA